MRTLVKYIALGLAFTATACNKWLDVKPNLQKTTDEIFSSQNGFFDALNGCYMKMKDRKIYGENLTMTYSEVLAQLWKDRDKGTPAYELKRFQYDGDSAKAAIKAIYGGLFNTIAQANMIINNIDEHSSVFASPAIKAIVTGEAYAIRAYCQLDILRLFGQVPLNPTQTVSLPYAESVNASNLPGYYNYEAYVQKLESDLLKAEELLRDNDPIFRYTFAQLGNLSNTDLEDDFLINRQYKLNYWAVKALEARFYLYTGNTGKAYATARSIIDAKGADGNTLIALSGLIDMPALNLSLPNECLFMLDAYDVYDYSKDILGVGNEQIVLSKNYVMDKPQLDKLFEGDDIANNNRHKNLWNTTLTDNIGKVYAALAKYHFNRTNAGSAKSASSTIPMLRMSEIYLIAIETTTDLAEANMLWKAYKASESIQIGSDAFASFAEVKSAILKTYRSEFFGEGQMFYTYKRNKTPDVLWKTNTGSVTEQNYIVPLPATEFDPSNNK